ncbi:hypothetical protein [Alistipes finegoldii]|uniref:hypothetical protein n=3 Tax=Alistipes finegoldii TaxID=214856 RepID=UPI0026773C0D|nr:hypothetical protein [Alistipes finegoldii]
MSALSFKITTDTAKVNNFRKSLERLYELLEKFPSKSSGFKVINRHISDLETRVDQAIRKIAKMQQQAAESAAKVATPATPTATPSNSKTTSGSQTAQAEAAAYKDLIGTIREASAQKKIYTAQIELLKTKTQALTAEYNALSKAEKNNAAVSQAQKDKRLDLSLSIAKNKEELALYQGTLKNIIKTEQFAEGSINKMSQSLTRMKNIYRNLSAAEREGTRGQTMLKNIDALDTKIKELDAAMGVHTRNVGNYASGFNMLGFQIQQVARELPSLAYGPQIFFSAISNNLPMLADEISHAKKSVDELKKAGQTFTPVWKQIASSIFSWQTLLVAGVTILTLYGKEITSWVTSLFKGKTAIDAAAAALEQFNSAMAQGSVSAQSELTKLNLLYNAATDLSKPYEERAEAVKKLQDIYPAYFGNMAAEQIMVGNAVGAYENLRDAIIEVAQAQAAKDIITENATKRLKITTSNEYKRIQLYANRIDELQSKINDLQNKGISKESPIIRGLIGSIAGLEKGIERASKAIRTKLELPDDIPNDIREYLALLDEADKELAPTAEKLYTTKTPAELNAEAEKARQAAKNAAEKAASEQERNYKDLTKKLQKLQDDSEQAEIDSMEEGTAKKLAQINLDYKKRARAIRDAEKELFELQRKEIDAQYKNDTSSERFLAGQQMVAQYKGNVKHLARPLVKAAELVKKGWEDAGEGIATVFSSQFGILDAKGKVTEILVTPILPNGDILSPQELDDYIYTQLEGAQDILAADTKGLVIATNVAADGSAGEKYHKLQGVYYADNIKAAEGVREYATAVREANQALKDEEWMNAFLSEAGIKNTKEYLNEQLDAWNEYYMKYGTILEKMQATKEYYDRKISLAKDAGTAEALRAEKDAAMAALEVEGGDFVNSLISKTKEDIEKLKREIKVALKTLEDEFNKLPSSDSEQGDDLRNKINVLRAQLSAINKLDPVSDEEHSESFEKWQKLYSTLTKIEGQFNDIGEAAGGAMGEVISTASKITVNSLKMIDSIKTLAENSAEGIEKTGEVAATTIQKVERASVILAIIQAALKVIQSIASIFGDTETSMERNIREAQELNEELRVMNERARLNSDIFSTIFGHDAFGDYVNNVTALTDAMNAYQATMDKIRNRGEEFEFVGSKGEATGLANLRKRAKEWENLYASIANMQVQVRHSTWLRSAKYKSLKDMLPELFEGNNVNMQALKEFVEGNSDTFKHLTKENQTYLKELVNNWETYEEAIKAVNDYLNDMFGELGTTLTDALVDSFEQGTNAADAFGEAAGNMLKNLAKQVLYTATIGPEIEKAQKKIDAINRDLSLSDEERYNALAGVVDTMLDDVLAQQKVGQELWERLKQAAEERGLQWETEAGGQEATSRGFQAMSQDTGDELNGRFTDIQGKVTDIRGYVMAMAQTGGIITAINNIATLGDRIDQMSVACYESLRFDAETLIEVREINSSTKNMDKTLARIEEGINSIKKNTESL